jgi:hypothetical protein
VEAAFAARVAELAEEGAADQASGLTPHSESQLLRVNNAVVWHVDKGALTLSEPRRYRDRAHLRFVSARPCLICGRRPTDAHHLRFAQPRALGRRVSDESPSRCAGATIGRSTGMVTSLRGGRPARLIRSRRLVSCGSERGSMARAVEEWLLSVGAIEGSESTAEAGLRRLSPDQPTQAQESTGQ